MSSLFRDLRYGLRLLLRQPTFTLAVVITLALAIGANTAIFTVVNAALLRSLPYRDPDALVHLWETKPQKEFPTREASYPDFVDWRGNDAFAGMAGYSGGGSAVLSRRDGSERVQIGSVTANFFDVLGVNALVGRTFGPEEDQAQSASIAILSYGLWQRLFGGDPQAVGQVLKINDINFTVVGVLPPSFHFAPRGGAELWVTWRPGEAQRNRRYMHWVNVIARLKPGVSRVEAQAAMGVISQRIAQAYPDSHTDTGIKLVPLREQFVGPVRPILLALGVAVGVVLLIACANIANLLLARSIGRQKEIAIRAALGATRGSLIRQLITESLLLALVGGLLGFLLAQLGVDALIAGIPESRLVMMPFLRGIGLDAPLLAFTSGLSLVVGVLFGLAPAIQVTQISLQHMLKEGGRSLASSARNHMRNGLIVAEIALAFVLLVGGGLMFKSFMRLISVDPGFDTKNLLTMRVSLPPAKYRDDSKVAVVFDQLISRLEALPGVKGAATVNVLPIIGGNTSRIIVEGKPIPPPGEETEVNLRDASARYFRTMGVPLLRGRDFGEHDNRQAPMVVIVNQTLADRILPGEDPIGRRVIFSGDDRTPVEIVGVVGDERVNGLDANVTPVVYYPFLQELSRTTSLVVRTGTDPNNLAAAIRHEALSVEPDLSIYGVMTMEELIANSPATFARRYPAMLIGLFAALALVLAATGLYGVISYSVSQQTREVGIRLALGASPRDILKLVIGRGLALTIGGLGTGLVVALVVTRFLSTLLFGVSATDPAVFASLALLLGCVALLACFVPARRATRVDPLRALRYE